MTCVHPYYKKENAFKLNDLLTFVGSGKPFTADFEQLKELDNSIFDKTKSRLWDSVNSKFLPYVEDLFFKLCSYYLDEYVVVKEEDTLNNDDCYAFYKMLLTLMDLTYDRYATMLSSYEAVENDLLRGLKSEGVRISRFNDTPQGDETDFEYEGESHVTNITKGKDDIVTENESMISRLNEIRSKYANVYKEWLKEFSGLFIEGGNLNIYE